MPSHALVPFRWPSAWIDPALLRLIQSTPINCLLFDSSEQAKPVADAARAAGLTVMDWNSLGAASLADVKWDSAAPYVAITGLVWPQIKRSAHAMDGMDAGPTGAPWIDSNTWVTRLAAARAPQRTAWLGFERPADDPVPAQAAYTIAIADTVAGGARWMVALDAELQKGLPAGNESSLKTWNSIVQALAFFENHPGWAALEPWAGVGVLSTFAGKNEFMEQELLNLAARRSLLYRVLDRSASATQKFSGLPAILYLDPDPPAAALESKLTAFVESGGMLIVPHALAAAFPGRKSAFCPVAGYELRGQGKGTIAAATEDWDDPYFLALDVHNLVRRRNDPVTLFNAGSLWEHYSAAPDGRSALLQLVGFTSQPYKSVSLSLAKPWRQAALHTIGAEQPVIVEPKRVEGRMEFHLPSFSYFAALELRS